MPFLVCPRCGRPWSSKFPFQGGVPCPHCFERSVRDTLGPRRRAPLARTLGMLAVLVVAVGVRAYLVFP